MSCKGANAGSLVVPLITHVSWLYENEWCLRLVAAICCSRISLDDTVIFADLYREKGHTIPDSFYSILLQKNVSSGLFYNT